ncbi:MAG: hypothetical protein II749_03340 [Clostridia bacterium]|nr:hypothetical protein [Clostridia bacterium]
MKKMICLVTVFVMMLTFASCTRKEPVKGPVSEPAKEPVSEPVKDNGTGTKLSTDDKEEINVDTKEDRYSARLVDLLYKRHKENVVVSDLSIKMALAMCLEGADGTTKAEMLAYFGAKDEREVLDKMTELLSSQTDDETVKMLLANMILYNDDTTLSEAYIKKIQEDFDITPLERKLFSDETATEINDFVKKNTRGLIERITKKEDLEDLKLFLVNTLYFKGTWAHEIDYSAYEDTFHGLDKDNKVTFYNDTVDTYFENDKAVAFAKQYYGNYEFIGILPKEEGDFDLESLDLAGLLESRDYSSYDVDIILPKLDIEYGGDITDCIKEDGLRTAFDPLHADFSGMSEDTELVLSKVIHKTRLKLDGKGTEAAAVTAIGMKATGMFMPEEKEKKEVHLTRPFVFIIYDYTTDTALFTGKIIDL